MNFINKRPTGVLSETGFTLPEMTECSISNPS
ncbi:hypothetical protein SS209_01224 [Salmonella enterica subsp. enterica serovar Senftenberg str. SS209]|nr:hypothetical protein SS209_01224 [Salmonella enterica subsp. enterica serovar Senftenberg str. SS209]